MKEETPLVSISIDAAYTLSEEIAKHSGERCKTGSVLWLAQQELLLGINKTFHETVEKAGKKKWSTTPA